MDPLDYDEMVREAEKLNEQVESDPSWPKESTVNSSGGEGKPGDDFNVRGSWMNDVLGPAGWTFLFERFASGLAYWRRPDKTTPGCSATTGTRSKCGKDLLYVFSSNATPFAPKKPYSKFRAYTLLHHGGDFFAASAALRGLGYGEQTKKGPRIFDSGATNGTYEAPPKPNADTSADPLDQDATAVDLIAANAVMSWAWERWLPFGVLTIIASEPGVGKTRLCADLARRVFLGLPWPDGGAATFAAGSRVLWVPADNQHCELGTLPGEFGFEPDALVLNTTRREPFAGTMLDEPNDLADFEARIARVRPALVFVDTCLNATDRSSHKPEDAKAFFVPLAQIALRQQAVIICLTHLNMAGKPLGRRIEGQGRVVWMLERPDPDGQPFRRKLYVRKSNSLYPVPLGITMGGHGNEYDTEPPTKPDEGPARGGPSGEKLAAARQWLQEALKAGPKRVSHLRDDAEKEAIGAGALYRAKESLDVEEYQSQGKKWWRLPTS